MKGKGKVGAKTLKIVARVGLLLGVIVICSLFFPRHASYFKYFYEVGKPWGYELLTAEKDFPIYKTEAQLKAEQAQVLKGYTPYFRLESSPAKTALEQLETEPAWQKWSNQSRAELTAQIARLFEQGILSAADWEQLQKEGCQKVTILQGKVAHPTPIGQLHTPKTAYSALLQSVSALEAQQLSNLHLNDILVPNLTFDTVTSEHIKEGLLQSVSLTEGMVQAGARIIDRGEIVTEETQQILSSLKIFSEDQGNHTQSWLSRTGDTLLLCLFLVLLSLFLYMFRRTIFDDMRSLLFLAILIVVMVGITALCVAYTKFSIYLVPFAWVPIMVCVFYDSRTAFFLHIITVLIASLIAPAPFEFLVIELAVGIIAITSLRDMSQRAQLAQTAGWVLLGYAVAYTAFTLALTGDFTALNWKTYLCFLINAILIVCAYGLVYLCEKSFGFVSSITLVELTNVNGRLLLELSEKAPGTFQHSLQVSNLATEAARKVGANTLLVRTGALYHDIGKINNPHYFTENQGTVNPLNEMSYQEAAKVIIAHVTDGIQIAQKNHLPATIVQFIRTHHGTSKTLYFYNKYANEHLGEEIDPAPFTYPGPRPMTKEGGIIMMADAVEARSRSLEEYTEQSIDQMVEQMINAQMNDGQFKDTPLTFKDVEDIKAVFKEKLTNIYHHRIAYPERKMPS